MMIGSNQTRKNNRVGEIAVSTSGIRMRIIAYRNALDIDVQFENGEVVKNKTYANFISGHIKPSNSRCDKIVNIAGQRMELIEYRDINDIDVLFNDTGLVLHGITYKQLISKRIVIK